MSGEGASYRRDVYEVYAESTRSEISRDLDLTAQARQFAARWARFLPRDRALPILDLGCGAGDFLWFLQRSGYRELYGVDVSAQQIELARQRTVAQVSICDALRYLQDYSERFVVVSALNLLEHFTYDELMPLMASIRKALRPGGMLLATVPNAASPFGCATRYWDLTHQVSFTPASMTQLLMISGFSAVRFAEYGPVVHGLKSGVRMAFWQVVRAIYYLYQLIEVGGDRFRIYTRDMCVVAFKPAEE